MKTLKQKFSYYLMAAPAVLLSMMVVLIPAISTIISSFTDWNGVADTKTFIGFQNYIDLFNDDIFKKALVNNTKWLCMFIIIPVALGLIAAACLLYRKKSKSFFQVAYLCPYVIAPIANSVLWLTMIYNPVSGVFSVLGLSSPLVGLKSALPGVAAVDIWHYWGFLAIVFFSAMRQTPTDQVEAALVEGCNGVQLFRYVYFPSMLPTFKLMLIMIVINSFRTFDYVNLLTRGGPAHSTETLATYSYTLAFSMFQYGKAAAVALIMSLVGLIASCFYVRISRGEEAD